MLFMGTILFSFSLFGKVIGLLMLGNALFNVYILFRYPQFDDEQRKDAQAEIKDFLATNPAFAQQIMAAGVSSGASLAASNPDVARQLFGAFFGGNQNQSPPAPTLETQIPQYSPNPQTQGNNPLVNSARNNSNGNISYANV